MHASHAYNTSICLQWLADACGVHTWTRSSSVKRRKKPAAGPPSNFATRHTATEYVQPTKSRAKSLSMSTATIPLTVPLESDFAGLPEDALITIYTFLPAFSLRSAAASNTAWCRALRRAPLLIRQRASWLHHWTLAGAGATIQQPDSAVCTGDGNWTPGGLALASTVHLTRAQNTGFRFVVEDAAPGDLLMGLTLHQPDTAAPPAAAGALLEQLLGMGYHYMMGRRIDADGEIQTSPSALPDAGGSLAPRSIFYGGRSRRCVFATPGLHSNGPTMDMGPDGNSPSTLAKLRHVGDWVEFSIMSGTLRATDHRGQTHVWGTQVEEGEVWVPTLAWTGSRAAIRIAPPALS